MRDVARPRRRRRAGAPPQGDGHGEVVAALDAGLDELDDSDADPRRAVIACWVRLEEAAAAAGIATARPATPPPTWSAGCCAATESGVRIASADVLDGFADVYRRGPVRHATRSTSGCGTRPGPRCAGCAANCAAEVGHVTDRGARR